MSNYQQMVDEALEQYEQILEMDQDEQNLIGDRTEKEMNGLKLHALRNAASTLFPHADQRQLNAMLHSDWMDERLHDVQYEIVQRKVKMERAMELLQVNNHFDEVA
ncbi:hypothetical protein [Serratia sp. UGAL515B_01]|uniref:hypothetical protein n=1 Tax=Serratia sp. UGAL515B_01 TaxID=2986763 RepID=UPI002953D8B6|nr:hypothetical protein [Serratia sp. UGAL515B_01]WON77544.1 hypothetical protein OK023_02225 [Serratia sp. UGAL515B_01]